MSISTDESNATPAHSLLYYLKWAIVSTIIGLALGAWLGWETTGTLGGTATIFFIVAVLAVLEISLSFDNAIVNANKLKGTSIFDLFRSRVGGSAA